MARQLSMGWIGLGAMGQAMAPRLLRAGFPLTVWNRTTEKMDALASEGAQIASSPCDVAAVADVTITMVSGPDDVEAVYLGPGGVVQGIGAGKTAIDMSTVDPATSRKVANALHEVSADFLDAPVSGSQQPAADGTLTILVGGNRGVYTQCAPIFDVLGSRAVHAGGVGMGSAMKLVINVMLAHLMATLSEAVIFAERLGLDAEEVIDVAATGSLQTPWFLRQGQRVMARDFAPNFALKHMHKDVRLALTLAKEVGVPLKVTEAIGWLYDEAAHAGCDDLNYSAIMKVVEAATYTP